jgi:putative toxin-antitoxin system antitoxin component (TIGR02293 family)
MVATRKRRVDGSRGQPGEQPFAAGTSLGLKNDNLLQVAKQVQAGLPYRALLELHKRSTLPLETIAQVVRLPRRTLARRKVQGKLTGLESERLLRLAVVFEKAVGLFEGDVTAARNWLDKPSRALGNETPLTTAETEIGARAVEDLMGRLEHGVFV